MIESNLILWYDFIYYETIVQVLPNPDGFESND